MEFRRLLVLLVAALLLFGGGFFTRGLVTNGTSEASAQTRRHPLLAKRVFIEDPNDPIINFEKLRESFNIYFTDNQLSGGLYFEYLPTGTSIRVNGDLKEIAASLMKLPAAMDAYKAAETGKIKLDKEITLQPDWLDSDYGDLYKKGAGYKLTLREAIQIMLSHSDNTALRAVAATTAGLIPPRQSVLNAVDVDFSQNPDLTVSIGARSYSSFLKCLYFACYDNVDDSQSILKDLTQTEFADRLVAGVADKNIVVAHKIGVHSDVQSDCGIIYLPNRNYLLCVMLQGTNQTTSDRHIAALSKLAYEYVQEK